MKKVLYVLLGLVVLYLILALIGPKQVNIEREISISKPASAYKDKLADYYFFNEKWNPWAKLDSNIKIEYSGTPGQPGHRYIWEGNDKVRDGEMEIVAIKQDTLVQDIYFGKGGKMGIAKAYFITSGDDASSKVKWQMTFDVSFMKRPFMLFANMDKMMGSQFEKGLSSLKTAVEEMKSGSSVHYDIIEEQWEEKTFISTTHTTIAAEQIGAFLGANFPRMFADLKKNNIQPIMAPSMAYYSWNEQTMQTECAAIIQVPGTKDVKGWEKCIVPRSKVLKLVYLGDYGNIKPAHDAMHQYMQEKGYKENLVIEEYVTDPGTEKDSAKWVTNVFYVIK